MLRVVEWSTGTVGRHAIAGILARPELELVGVYVSNPDKDGRDVGQLADLGHDIGLAATSDKQALIDLAPDCIVHTAMTDDRMFQAVEDLISFLEAGINVVSSGPVVLIFPSDVLGPDIPRRIAEAGERTGASLHINGIDPGFANDVLPLTITSVSQRIDEVRVSEIADYSTYYQPVVMGDIFGFGQPIDSPEPGGEASTQLPLMWQPGVLSTAWGGVVRQIAAGLDLTLDEPLIERYERSPAEFDVDTYSCPIAKGTMGAVRFEVIGTVDGTPRVVLEHVTRTHVDQRPDWPQPLDGSGGCYRVEVKGEPNLSVEFRHEGENGDHNVSGMITTAMRLVNSVEAVVAAKPGLVTALDLPVVTGRGLVSG